MPKTETELTIDMIVRCVERQPIYATPDRCANCGAPVTRAAKWQCATCAIKAEIRWMDKYLKPRRA